MDAALRDELLAMAAEDEAVRAELAADGSLFDGYYPRIPEVHQADRAVDSFDLLGVGGLGLRLRPAAAGEAG